MPHNRTLGQVFCSVLSQIKIGRNLKKSIKVCHGNKWKSRIKKPHLEENENVAAQIAFIWIQGGERSPQITFTDYCRFCTACSTDFTQCSTKSCSFATSAGILVSILHKVQKKRTQYDFNLVPKWTVSWQMSDVRWHNYPSVTQSFCLKNEIHTTFSSARLLLSLSNTSNTNIQFFELCVIGR